MSDITFRDAREDDLQTLVALLADDDIAEGREQAKGDLLPAYSAAFDDMAKSPDNRILVAEQDGDIIGSLQIVYVPGLSRQGAKRAIIEAVDNNGLTPLHCACSCTNPEALFEVCSLLLTVAQADVTKKTHAGTTPLHYFVRNPCVDPVMYFETLVRARVFFFSLAPRSWHTAYQPP